MSVHRVEFTVSDETWGRLEAARGFEPRASFVKRAVEAFLPEPGVQVSRGVVRAVLSSEDGGVLEQQSYVEGALAAVEESESSAGCPECGGSWRGAVDGPYRVCMDCGLTERA